MKHCTVAYAYYESDYRVRRYAELFSKDSDNIVHVISIRKEGQPAQIDFNGAKVFQIQTREQNERTKSTYIYRLLKFIIKAAVKLTFLHARYKYDVIHVHNLPDFLVFCAVVPKLFGAKVILDIHDIMPELYCEKFNKTSNSILAKLLLTLEKLSVFFADKVIVANELWKERILQRTRVPSDRILSILNYPNLNFYITKEKKYSVDKFNIVYPGHISYHHGVDIIVNAMPIILKTIPYAKLYIYPITFIYDYKKQLEETIKNLGLSDSIIFKKPVAPDEVGKILEDAEIGIVTKRGGSFGAEAFSTKILDFFSAGLPVVCSKTKIDEYYFSDKYLQFFHDDNVDDCAKKVISLWHDVERRKQLSSNGIEYVKENNWLTKSQLYTVLL